MLRTYVLPLLGILELVESADERNDIAQDVLINLGRVSYANYTRERVIREGGYLRPSRYSSGRYTVYSGYPCPPRANTLYYPRLG